MAVVTIPDQERTITDLEQIKAFLAGIGIDYERWEAGASVAADAPAEEILAAYSSQIEQLKARGNYVTADVIDVTPRTAGLEEMLAKFNVEHSHDEDEVRYIVAGRGLFHIHPQDHPVVAIEVTEGDLIRVPRGTLHWFNLCSDRRIRAIRLFQDKSGWVPRYSGSGVDAGYRPVCFGSTYIPPSATVS
jgi:1,2-dihydroxy-3-keto-5-methylthiopentene dioxygenase